MPQFLQCACHCHWENKQFQGNVGSRRGAKSVPPPILIDCFYISFCITMFQTIRLIMREHVNPRTWGGGTSRSRYARFYAPLHPLLPHLKMLDLPILLPKLAWTHNKSFQQDLKLSLESNKTEKFVIRLETMGIVRLG